MFRTVNGKQYLVHKVKETDSLEKLSLQYKISVKAIKMTNELISDQIFSRAELLLPVQPGMQISVEEPESEEKKLQKERDRR